MASPALPVHPYRTNAERHGRIGLLVSVSAAPIAFLGVTSGTTGLVPLAVAFGLVGVTFLRLSSQAKDHCDALVARGIAIDLAERGEHDAAETLLAGVRARSNAAWRAILVERAALALDRDPAEAEARASAALARAVGGFSRDAQEMQNAHAKAIRAMARAALGKEAEALADVAAVRASEAAMPEVLALAAVAEQVVLSRRGDLRALRAALEAARPLLDATSPRERALVRAFRRLVAARQTSAYREPGRTDDAPRTEAALAGWAGRIAPEAATFLPETERRAQTAQADVTQPASTPVGAGSTSIAREAGRTGGASRRGPLAAVIAVFFLLAAIELFTAPVGRPGSLLAFGTASSLVLLAFFFGRLTTSFRSDAAGRRALLRARRLLATGDTSAAGGLFATLARSNIAGTAGAAHLELAILAERRTDLRAALEHCDAGLAALARGVGGTALHADLLLPRLVSERAFVLAGLGRPQLADAELAVLAGTCPSYAHLASAIFRTRLLSALRGLALTAATELARERTPQLALGLHEETMADAVLALHGGHPRELARLHEELGADASLARWLDYMLPGAREQIAARASAI